MKTDIEGVEGFEYAPVMGRLGYVPWSIHVAATDMQQRAAEKLGIKWTATPESIALAGGFSGEELDRLFPGWRGFGREINLLRITIAAYRDANARAQKREADRSAEDGDLRAQISLAKDIATQQTAEICALRAAVAALELEVEGMVEELHFRKLAIREAGESLRDRLAMSVASQALAESSTIEGAAKCSYEFAEHALAARSNSHEKAKS